MQRICFVCTGNICRSPMAEFLFRVRAQRAGRGGALWVASAGVRSELWGNPVYPPARRMLAAHGIDCRGKTARQLRPQDAEAFDLFVGMDDSNLRGMRRILGPAAQERIHLLLEYADRARPGGGGPVVHRELCRRLGRPRRGLRGPAARPLPDPLKKRAPESECPRARVFLGGVRRRPPPPRSWSAAPPCPRCTARRSPPCAGAGWRAAPRAARRRCRA